eukprot:10833754-Alexandrium_andersonii.AAC.1
MSTRAEGIKFIQSWNVRDVRPVSECWARAGKGPIGGRWVDHNKGDLDVPHVAKDIAVYRDDF